VNEQETALTTYLGIAAEGEESRALRMLIELGVQVVGGDEGSLLLYDEARGDLVFAMTTAPEEQAATLLGKRLQLGTGLTGLAAATQEVQIGTPSYEFPEADGGAGSSTPVQHVLAAPLLIDDKMIGVITAVTFDAERRFGTDDAKLYATAAAIASLVVEQHGRIEAFHALSEKGVAGLADVKANPALAAIIGSVTRLSRVTDLADVARLLELVEAFTGTEPSD
jgi:transcriptional regulator with GAF, ATPase, and Fis domain